ncbi:YafY family transcriptional regulator [Aggregicoccus sp. 17bor-14]|uniref:helix-turn-helix transcriptional regulator n=1 Tax=Myxococcaceae TaxID=31 RepID=UPI00129CBB38|nr:MULTISPECIES: YafY family protein [Myxococcaceae]MBF5045228.1 YafY family transcriptional regulator [Simulacricoccus sp. 17bor-14]MRI90969.1 YafY family transcriptional regulator [Aggregicoccus sp. 17bor-14]
MSRPTTRVLAVLELLQTHGRLSGAELAARLEVDRRTVRRYIAALEELGIPLTAERGRDGHYGLVAGFKLPPMMFTDDEALALSVGLLAARGLGLAEGAPAVASAQAKLERVMPAGLKRRVRAVDETVALELARPREPARDNAALVSLAAAAQAQERVRLRYAAAAASGEETERDFDPFGLAYRQGRWYVVGTCHLRGGLRSFRLDRVRGVVPQGLHFERPRDFDALAHLTRSLATLPRAHAVQVLLRTDLERARREVAPSFGVLEPAPGGVLLRTEAEELPWVARELSRLSFPFEVQQPAALRDVLAEHARRLLALARGA